MPNSPTIIFIPIEDSRTKIVLLCQKIQEQFLEGKTILIRTPTQEAAEFLNNKLWSTPPENFVPHLIAHEKTNALVVLTPSTENLNGADTLFNLTATIPPDLSLYKTVFELYDTTQPDKQMQSDEKKRAYASLS